MQCKSKIPLLQHMTSISWYDIRSMCPALRKKNLPVYPFHRCFGNLAAFHADKREPHIFGKILHWIFFLNIPNIVHTWLRKARKLGWIGPSSGVVVDPGSQYLSFFFCQFVTLMSRNSKYIISSTCTQLTVVLIYSHLKKSGKKLDKVWDIQTEIWLLRYILRHCNEYKLWMMG